MSLDLMLFIEKAEPGYVSWRAYLPQTHWMHGPYQSQVRVPNALPRIRQPARQVRRFGPSAAERS